MWEQPPTRLPKREQPDASILVSSLLRGVLPWQSDERIERKGLAYGWYNCAIGIATLPASLIFGALYQVFGALVAFAWGAALALAAVVLLAAVKGRRTSERGGD